MECKQIAFVGNATREAIPTGILPDVRSVAAMPTQIDIIAMASFAMFIDENELMAAPVKGPHAAIWFDPHANVQELSVDVFRRFLKNPEMAPIDAVKVQRAVDAVPSHQFHRRRKECSIALGRHSPDTTLNGRGPVLPFP